MLKGSKTEHKNETINNDTVIELGCDAV